MTRAGSARAAVTALFVVHAAVLGAWTPVIPVLTRELGLSTGQLGLALAAEPVGAGAVMIATGALVQRFASRRVLRWAVVPYAVSTACVGLAPDFVWFSVALLAWGATQGVMNVSMNAQGVVLEERLGRPVLAGLHGCWSLGAFGGAAAASWCVGQGAGPAAVLSAVGGLALVVVVVAGVWFVPGTGGETAAGGVPGRRRMVVRPDARLVGLASVAFACLLCEGAVLTWSGLFLTGEVGAPDAMAGYGYAAYALSMAGGRLVGDRATGRWGAASVLPLVALVGAVAVGVALVAPGVGTALAGFALLGVGLACVMPFMTRAAAQAAPDAVGPAVALVSSAGWVGVVAGPPLLGWVAAATSLTTALWALALLPLLIAVSAGVLLRRTPPGSGAADPDPTPERAPVAG